MPKAKQARMEVETSVEAAKTYFANNNDFLLKCFKGRTLLAGEKSENWMSGADLLGHDGNNQFVKMLSDSNGNKGAPVTCQLRQLVAGIDKFYLYKFSELNSTEKLRYGRWVDIEVDKLKAAWKLHHRRLRDKKVARDAAQRMLADRRAPLADRMFPPTYPGTEVPLPDLQVPLRHLASVDAIDPLSDDDAVRVLDNAPGADGDAAAGAGIVVGVALDNTLGDTQLDTAAGDGIGVGVALGNAEDTQLEDTQLGTAPVGNMHTMSSSSTLPWTGAVPGLRPIEIDDDCDTDDERQWWDESWEEGEESDALWDEDWEEGEEEIKEDDEVIDLEDDEMIDEIWRTLDNAVGDTQLATNTAQDGIGDTKLGTNTAQDEIGGGGVGEQTLDNTVGDTKLGTSAAQDGIGGGGVEERTLDNTAGVTKLGTSATQDGIGGGRVGERTLDSTAGVTKLANASEHAETLDNKGGHNKVPYNINNKIIDVDKYSTGLQAARRAMSMDPLAQHAEPAPKARTFFNIYIYVFCFVR